MALGVEETSLTVRSCGRVGELVVTQLVTQRDSLSTCLRNEGLLALPLLVGSRAFKRSVVDVRGPLLKVRAAGRWLT